MVLRPLRPSADFYVDPWLPRYPAKFIPQLVNRVIDDYLPDYPSEVIPVIDDPFLGSGTTAVCAIARGHRLIGTDVSEVAWLIARAKATPIEPAVIEDQVQKLFDLLSRDVHRLEPHVPAVGRLDYWFPEEQKTELGLILGAIRSFEDEQVRTFLLCGFSHILKNCSRWLMKSSKPTIAKDKLLPRPLATLRRHLNKMLRGNRQFWLQAPADVKANLDDYLNIRYADARQQPCAANSVDLIVTSSPYVTSYEYADLHQLTALWLGFTDDVRDWRKKFIGSAHSEHVGYCRSTIAHRIAEDIGAHNEVMGKETTSYFLSMEQCFAESYRILKPGASAGYVIGNTALLGVPVLNAEVFVTTQQRVPMQ